MKQDRTAFALAFLLGYVTAVLSVGCPSDESLISPCMCVWDDYDVDATLACTEPISLDDLRKILDQFDRETVFKIELDRQNLGTLPSDFFDGYNVKKLEITHCELDSLAEEGGRALSGLENTLEELIIDSSFSEINSPINIGLSHLRSLEIVEISYNSITRLGNKRFPTSLTHLVLSNNGIKELADEAFSNLVNVDQLWLDGNRFGPIKRSMLPNAGNKLENLELDNNALTSIPEDIFTGMPVLREVSLRTNELSKISREIFKPVLEQLEKVDFRGNPLHCDSEVEWMLSAKHSAKIHGECYSPPERRGKQLEDLIAKRM